MATESILDKRFVGAAIAIGLAYSLIVVVLLACLLGKDAAGVAAVALTALAAAIFKQFETLRFRQIPERESTVIFVQRLYSWYLLLLMFSFYGLSVVFWVLPGTLSHKVWRHSPAGYIQLHQPAFIVIVSICRWLYFRQDGPSKTIQLCSFRFCWCRLREHHHSDYRIRLPRCD